VPHSSCPCNPSCPSLCVVHARPSDRTRVDPSMEMPFPPNGRLTLLTVFQRQLGRTDMLGRRRTYRECATSASNIVSCVWEPLPVLNYHCLHTVPQTKLERERHVILLTVRKQLVQLVTLTFQLHMSASRIEGPINIANFMALITSRPVLDPFAQFQAWVHSHTSAYNDNML